MFTNTIIHEQVLISDIYENISNGNKECVQNSLYILRHTYITILYIFVTMPSSMFHLDHTFTFLYIR
jgi:hypothetical protein